MKPALWVVIPSAGKGRRFGSVVPKQYLHLLDKTVLEHTLQRFLCRKDVAGIVVAVSGSDFPLAASSLGEKVMIVEGGEERTASVYNALDFLSRHAAPSDLVAVHDAARPCVRQSSLDKLFAVAMSEPCGAVLAQRATDTVKWVDEGSVGKTLDRNHVWLAQTPQVFPLDCLKAAIERAAERSVTVTDESSAVELLGLRPVVVEGAKDNIKITVPEDLQLAAYFLEKLIQDND